MYYGTIKTTDVANGPGVRVSLFVSGCTHHCEECFQPETWDFQYGDPYTERTQQEIVSALSNSFIEGLTILGGEPFEPDNQRTIVELLREIHERCPEKSIWIYTGYQYEELTGMEPGTGRARCEVTDEILSYVDVLVDGEFEIDKKDISLQFRGSSNQRLICVPESRKQGKIVWWEDSIPYEFHGKTQDN